MSYARQGIVYSYLNGFRSREIFFLSCAETLGIRIHISVGLWTLLVKTEWAISGASRSETSNRNRLHVLFLCLLYDKQNRMKILRFLEPCGESKNFFDDPKEVFFFWS